MGVRPHADVAAAPAGTPPGLGDSDWNNWRPLLSIASVVGGQWPLGAAAAAALSAGGTWRRTGTMVAIWLHPSTWDVGGEVAP